MCSISQTSSWQSDDLEQAFRLGQTNTELPDVFAKIASENFTDLDDAKLKKWSHKDPKLGYKIIKCQGVMLSEVQQAPEDEREQYRRQQKTSPSPKKKRKT